MTTDEDFAKSMMVGQTSDEIISVLLGEQNFKNPVPHFFSAEINKPKNADSSWRKMDVDNPRIQNRSPHSFWAPFPMLFNINLRGGLSLFIDKTEQQKRIGIGGHFDHNKLDLHNVRIK